MLTYRAPYIRCFIEDIIFHGPGLKSFILSFEDFPEVYPGQFIMVWVPGFEEIPLSPSNYTDGSLRITVRERGETTRRIHGMGVGDILFIRGPYGVGFDLSHNARYLLVGGGYGSAPIIYAGRRLVEKGFRCRYVEGVSSKIYSLFIDEALELGLEPILVTEDGSSGVKGLVTEYVENIISDYDIVLGCGPEPMLIELLRICRRYDVACQLSLERFVKCGIAICGSCVLEGAGLLVCRDGPVFDGDTLYKIGFGGVC